jgi:hemoglobin
MKDSVVRGCLLHLLYERQREGPIPFGHAEQAVPPPGGISRHDWLRAVAQLSEYRLIDWTPLEDQSGMGLLSGFAKINDFGVKVLEGGVPSPIRISIDASRQTTVPRQEQAPIAPTQQPTLYERLGGIYSIATVIDDLIDRVMTDARLNANPAVNEAHHKVPPAGFKYLVTEMVGWASGGPQKYSGRSMRESHQHLNITPNEWEAFMDDVQQTLDKFKVPAAEQAELKEIVNSTYGDIVVGKPTT